jgi:hypothetical protein
MSPRHLISLSFALAATALAATPEPAAILEKRCYDCHDSDTHKGNLDLTALKPTFTDLDAFAKWVKVYDRIEAGEMPPKKKEQPSAEEKTALMSWLHGSLLSAEQARLKGKVRTAIHRLTRAEYENTMRDLFSMPGLALSGDLPADGSAHGFDKNSDALDISHVNLAKYIEAAEKTLDIAIATRPEAPIVQRRRISLANPAGFVAHVIMNGDGVLLKDKKPDPEFPPAADEVHLDMSAHERMNSFNHGATVGLFRHEDESMSPYFMDHVTIYPGLYRVRTSLWSFQWDKAQVLPSRGTEAGRLSVVQLTGDGRGGQHPSTVLGYYDAPSMEAKEHEVVTWMNVNEIIGFNTASLAPAANYARKGHAMSFTGPGIACDWLDVEGPLHEQWPPKSHELLFGKLPLAEFKKGDHPGVKPPARVKIRQIGAGKNRPDPEPGLWTVQSQNPAADADRLLADFLPKAFRHPVDAETRGRYVALAKGRLEAGDCFETAMRYAYRAALCAPEFLYHTELPGKLDDFAFASRLSYFFWNSMPDARLRQLAGEGTLRKPEVLRGEVERMLKDAKSQRFVEDFLGQWLKLRSIAANDADRKLYPEFNPYLQDSMVAETRAYFRELIEKNLDSTYIVKSDFAMLNQRLATHYGIPDVTGAQVRRVALPSGCPRGGFLTQAAILKVTANGTTTSPVPRGAFVMARLLGQPPEPPPADTPAVEPDVRGAITIREQLEKHRSDASCAGCHAKIDPAGFALEAFDVIGGFRTRYRSLENGDPAPRGSIDPFIGISFKLGPAVDATGALPDGRKFQDIVELENILASHPERLLRNLAEQLAIYSTGRDVAFGDREQIAGIIARTQKQGGGLRTLIHELVQSELFSTR